MEEQVLVVDDERDMAESCAFFLERAGFPVKLAFSGEEALDILDRGQFWLVITDLKMPRMTGLKLLDAIKSRDPDIEVLLITGYPEIDSAVGAIKRGAFDYIPKPFEEKVLMERVHKALGHRRQREEDKALRERVRQGESRRPLVYRSQAFGRLMEMAKRAALTDASILIQGESGTGKELIARYLHEQSERASQPFIPLDCASIPENLVESELFGHIKGAFTGAHADKIGLFQMADGGTLFLDEVGELPLSFQPRLLRAIQERQIRPVGSSRFLDVDVRLICATNRRLRQEVAAERFREDLFYRLDVVRLEVPPLRARAEDVLLLAEEFRREFAARDPSSKVEGFSPGALEALAAHDWPGNVRQLRNAVERACTLGAGPLVTVADLTQELSAVPVEASTPPLASDETFQEMKARRVAALESTYLENLLRRYGGNVTRSSAAAGMTRSSFQKLMQRYGIKSREYRKNRAGPQEPGEPPDQS